MAGRYALVPGTRPFVGVRTDRAALRPHYAKALAGRRFHHHPGLDRRNTLGAERLETADLGFDVVALDVEVHAALVIDLLHQHYRLVGARFDLHVLRVVIGAVRTAQRLRPESRCRFQIIRFAVDDDAAQPALVHRVPSLSKASVFLCTSGARHARLSARSRLNGPGPAADRYRNVKQNSTARSPPLRMGKVWLCWKWTMK